MDIKTDIKDYITQFLLPKISYLFQHYKFCKKGNNSKRQRNHQKQVQIQHIFLNFQAENLKYLWVINTIRDKIEGMQKLMDGEKEALKMKKKEMLEIKGNV